MNRSKAVEASAHNSKDDGCLGVVVRTSRSMHVPEVLVGTSPESCMVTVTILTRVQHWILDR